MKNVAIYSWSPAALAFLAMSLVLTAGDGLTAAVAESGPSSSAAVALLRERLERAEESARLQPGYQADFEVARVLHFLAGREDPAARKRAARLLEQLHNRDPDHALVRAYLGSARVLAAGHELLPWRKGELAKQGLALLDAAVAEAAGSAVQLEARLIRGITTTHLPEGFKRSKESCADLAAVAEAVLEHPDRSPLSDDLSAASLYRHAEAVRASGDEARARELRATILERWPDTPAARDVNRTTPARPDARSSSRTSSRR